MALADLRAFAVYLGMDPEQDRYAIAECRGLAEAYRPLFAQHIPRGQ